MSDLLYGILSKRPVGWEREDPAEKRRELKLEARASKRLGKGRVKKPDLALN